MNIANWLARQAAHAPDRPAIYLGKALVADYGAFHGRSLAMAGALSERGVGPGDRVAIFMPNAPDYLYAFFGIWYAGAVAVPINAKLHGREAAFIVENSGAALILAGAKEAEALREAGVSVPISDVTGGDWRAMLAHDPVPEVAARKPEDLAWLFYTSGTTGRPKGVMINHRMLIAMSLAYGTDVDAVRAEDATLYAAPMSHGAGIYAALHVKAGAAHICPRSGGFEPGEIFDLAAHFGSVHMFAAPTMVQRMTRAAQAAGAVEPKPGVGLRTVIYAGGPMYNADIIEAEALFGPVFAQIYGQGECPMGITALPRADVSDRSHPRWRARLGSVGRAQSPVEVAIGDTEGRVLPVGEHGEIMVRGDTVMPGYWQNPEATAQTLVNGWLMTGDMGVMDAEGYVTMQDRSKDMIITGGSNVYPREVEEVLLSHPQVEQASVVGRAHAEWGEEVVAFVVGTAAEEELDRLCLENIARFKRPKAYIRVPDLPKNSYGKVLKTELRAQLAAKSDPG